MVSVESPYTISLEWQISERYSEVEIYRCFIHNNYLVGRVGSSQNNFTDYVDFGTYYEYFIRAVARNGAVLDVSDKKSVFTPIDTNHPGAPKWSREQYLSQKYTYRSLSYLNYSDYRLPSRLNAAGV